MSLEASVQWISIAVGISLALAVVGVAMAVLTWYNTKDGGGTPAPPPPTAPQERSAHAVSEWTAEPADQTVHARYLQLASTKSDINEHLPVLRDMAKQCTRIAEFGVRGVVSSWAFLDGLSQSVHAGRKELWLNDLDPCDTKAIVAAGAPLGVHVTFTQGSDLEVPLPEWTDLAFIDTWHVYGQLRRELARIAPMTRKIIALHDTTVDGEVGEVVRYGGDVEAAAKEIGWPAEDVGGGLWRAVEEFLEAERGTWKLGRRFTHNNGLTVLVRQG